MAECDFCTEGLLVHPDDFIRVNVVNEVLVRPAYCCPQCLELFRRCEECRWYSPARLKCRYSPFTVSKKKSDWCGKWKQDASFPVAENKEEGCPKFEVV